jgi:hypothetical protein
MPNQIHAIFDDPAKARRAIEELLAAGAARADVTMMSSEPYLDRDPHMAELHRTRIPLFSIVGGLLGAGTGFGLVYFTSHSYPVVTGGMPLVPPLTTGIVMYEMTAMGAIFFALARMLWEARLPRLSAVGEDYAPELADGGILVSVRATAVNAERWRSLLRSAGGREPISNYSLQEKESL